MGTIKKQEMRRTNGFMEENSRKVNDRKGQDLEQNQLAHSRPRCLEKIVGALCSFFSKHVEFSGEES